jgi:hypothetical protein
MILRLVKSSTSHEQLTCVFEKLTHVIGISTNLDHSDRFACLSQ